MKNVGIVTGFGSLSEEVLALARGMSADYKWYTIKPWLPLLSDPVRVFYDFFHRSSEVSDLNPFYFSDIERELRSKDIKRVFFTGDFPRDRFLQAYLFHQIWGTLDKIADEKCMAYFNSVSEDVSNPIRYFVALSRLLKELNIKTVLACEIFPELNVPPGCASIMQVPPEILGQLPNLLVNLGKQLELTPLDRNRVAQAAIVDNGIIVASEAKGTDDLLETYGRRKIRRVMPFLLKPPSAEFDPALDQPTIGPRTVDLCKAAGVRGIVVCAETTTIVSKAVTIRSINDCEMFFYAMPFGQLRQTYLQHFPTTWAQNASIAAQPR